MSRNNFFTVGLHTNCFPNNGITPSKEINFGKPYTILK